MRSNFARAVTLVKVSWQKTASCVKHRVDIGMTEGGEKIKEGQLAQVTANLCTYVKHTYIGMA